MKDLIKDTPLIDREGYRERKRRAKSPAPSGIQIHDLSVTRRVLYRCATTAVALLKMFVFPVHNPGLSQLPQARDRSSPMPTLRLADVPKRGPDFRNRVRNPSLPRFGASPSDRRMRAARPVQVQTGFERRRRGFEPASAADLRKSDAAALRPCKKVFPPKF